MIHRAQRYLGNAVFHYGLRTVARWWDLPGSTVPLVWLASMGRRALAWRMGIVCLKLSMWIKGIRP